MKHSLTTGITLLLICLLKVQAQGSTVLTLEQCQQQARQNYPLVKQMALIEQSKNYTLGNAAKGYLPQFNLGGQATYQSDVTKIPFSLPNLPVKELSKDQYKVYGELTQSLTDPLVIREQKELIRTNAAAETEKLEVELYKLKERVNQLYFGILLMDAQIKLVELLKKDLQSAIAKTEAAISNGIAVKNNADLLNAELLKTEQRHTEFRSARQGYLEMLATFINQPLSENSSLAEPVVKPLNQTINRPELKLFEVQKKNFDIQNKLLLAKNLPRFSLFFQGGYGRPALNMLSNELEAYFIGGARLNWNLSGFYTFKKDKQLQAVSQHVVDLQKETFLLNTNMQLKQQDAEVNKLNALLVTDAQIIALREKIKKNAASQLENGTLTPLDYLTHVNAEDQARQNQVLHKIQLLQAQYNHQTTSGN